jgi:hypothetical protein
MIEQSDQIAFAPDKVSVRHRVCCWTLLSGRLTLFILFNVCVNHGSALELRTMLTVERGAKAAAEAGSNWIGIVTGRGGVRAEAILSGTVVSTKERTKENKKMSQANDGLKMALD